MRASALEFRLRVVIVTAILTLGFWAPWIEAWHIDQRRSVLAWLALGITRMGIADFRVSAALAIVCAIAVSAVALALRLWGTAYLGAFTVHHGTMQAGTVMADGPYRYVRNPLYLGTWAMTAAMGFAMPPSGALLALVLITVFQLRLVLGEEDFLRQQLGAPYEAYLASVPRYLPRLRSTVARGGTQPRWGFAVLSELNILGVLVAYAVFAWSYNNWRIIQAILVSFGLSLLVRALLPQPQEPAQA